MPHMMKRHIWLLIINYVFDITHIDTHFVKSVLDMQFSFSPVLLLKCIPSPCWLAVQINVHNYPRWRHHMEAFSALLTLCAGNSPVTSELPPQRSVTRSFDVLLDLCMNQRLSKQSRRWWFETAWLKFLISWSSAILWSKGNKWTPW